MKNLYLKLTALAAAILASIVFVLRFLLVEKKKTEKDFPYEKEKKELEVAVKKTEEELEQTKDKVYSDEEIEKKFNKT